MKLRFTSTYHVFTIYYLYLFITYEYINVIMESILATLIDACLNKRLDKVL